MYKLTPNHRHLATFRQGHDRDNRHVIPQPAVTHRFFPEPIGPHQRIDLEVQGYPFTFVVENTRSNSPHACTVQEVLAILATLPAKDYGDLRLVVLRQPSRLEQTLGPVWGRLVYRYEWEGSWVPAILLEAQDQKRDLYWPRRQTSMEQEEFKRLQADGHCFVAEGSCYRAPLLKANIRRTQLLRTLPHQLGHYAYYQQLVLRSARTFEEEMAMHEGFFNLPSQRKEALAHNYAEELRARLDFS